MKPGAKARKAIRKRIAALAPAADAADLVKLAEAESKLRFGTQGRTIYDQRVRREEPLEEKMGFGR